MSTVDDRIMVLDRHLGLYDTGAERNDDRSFLRAVYEARLKAVEQFLDGLRAEARSDAASVEDAYRKVAKEALMALSME